jgi:futalosine hydrolase
MSRTLILVPTEFELALLRPQLSLIVESVGATIAICGFGPIASGICTTRLLAEFTPESVILIGIAGALSSSEKIGTARVFDHIGCYGIGAGSGSAFQTASELGWKQYANGDSEQVADDTIRTGEIRIETNADAPMLLTVCAASASIEDVTVRLRKFPKAVAEDMEAFSVAMACRMARIPLTVIRGISNIAGDRNKANWNVAAALDRAAELAITKLSP